MRVLVTVLSRSHWLEVKDAAVHARDVFLHVFLFQTSDSLQLVAANIM